MATPEYRPTWPCLRCGMDLTIPRACCKDCRATDPDVCRHLVAMAEAAAARVAAHAHRLAHRPTPTGRTA